MKTTTSFLGCTALLLFLAATASAHLVEITLTPESGQDPLTIEGQVHELGNMFPQDESILSIWNEIDERPCLQNPDDPEIPNIVVGIINKTNRYWQELHYVADPETSLQNYDIHRINGMLAFKIDNVGANVPLINESKNPDLVFEPDEWWYFVIQDYVNAAGVQPSAFGSLGVPSGNDSISSGSIIAIPEPATVALLGLGGLLLRRKR